MGRIRLTLMILALAAILAGSATADMMFDAAVPDTGITGNSFVDMIYNNGVLWVASGAGLTYTTDNGLSWYTYDSQTGLNSDEPSAIFGRNDEVWVSCTHTQEYQGVNYPFGDGFNRTTDIGFTWESYTPNEASNFAHLVYDITGNDSSLYAACFHGGFIVSHDSGQTWEHLFFSPFDSTDYNADQWADLATGRYYSCAYDSSHVDTGVVYGGSADGVQKFLYIPKRVKLGGNRITSLLHAGNFFYIGHERGISQSDTLFSKFYTVDTLNGLGSDVTHLLFEFGGKVWASMLDPTDPDNRTGVGLYYLDNPAAQWTFMDSSTVGPPDVWAKLNTSLFQGQNGGVFDVQTISDSAIYIAAGDSGVMRSVDTGQTWTRFFIDSTDMNLTSRRNQVYSIDIVQDSIYLGTKGGLVRAAFQNDPFTITGDTLITFPESDSTGSFVSLVRHNDGQGDSSFTWLGLEPIDPASDSGNYSAVYMRVDGSYAVVLVTQGTPRTVINDIEVTTDITFIATPYDLFGAPNFYVDTLLPFPFPVRDTTNGFTLNGGQFLDVMLDGRRLYTGSTRGFGYLVDTLAQDTADWRIFRTNTIDNHHDLAVIRNRGNSTLPSDWIVAMDMQYYNADTNVVWAACRRVPDTISQTSGAAFSLDYGDTWTLVLDDLQIWNFDFDKNGVAYAAASEGLYYAPPPWTNWQKAAIVDAQTQDTVVSGTEVYSVAVADSVLWVGTALGLAKRPIDNPADWEIKRIFKAVENDEVYAAPVPYSPIDNSGRLTIHYHVAADASVTVEIYDFSMNLVRVLADGKFRAGGGDYFENWDGYNGRGDMVATGMYFIRVKYSTGEEKWGRLAIIP